MNLLIAFAAAVSGYLLGSISFARIIARIIAPGEDISKSTLEIEGVESKIETEMVGATSIRMRKGNRYGCLTSLLDMAKAALPTLAFRLYFPGTEYFLIAAAASMAGHNFPIYHRFKGGRGMSSLFGGLLFIDWLAVPITTGVSTLLGLVVLRDEFFAFTGGILLLIPWMWFRTQRWEYVAYAAIVNVIFWIAVLPELKSYLAIKRTGQLKAARGAFMAGWVRQVRDSLRRPGKRAKTLTSPDAESEPDEVVRIPEIRMQED